MREMGMNEPLALKSLTKADKDLAGTTTKNIRAWVKKNHEDYLEYQKKAEKRKVSKRYGDDNFV